MTRIGAADLAEWIRARAIPGHRLIVGLAGPPGSGKSTLAGHASGDLAAPVVPMDGYHLPNSELDRRGLREVKGAPETFDVDAFVAMLRSLRHGRDVSIPDFDRTIDEPRPDRIVVPGESDIVLVEGNYLLVWERVADLLDVVAHLEVPRHVRVRRLVDRHVEFGKTPAEARAFVERSDERNASLVEAAGARADLVVVL